jgi:hypothetical protein
MDAVARDAVRRRAAHQCEYCLLRQAHSETIHHIEHIVARQHGGHDELDNLALACHRCNLQKGPNLSGIDLVSGNTVALFHPRRDRWLEHFQFRGATIEGLTPTGRATVDVLALNDHRRLDLRSELLARGELG